MSDTWPWLRPSWREKGSWSQQKHDNFSIMPCTVSHDFASRNGRRAKWFDRYAAAASWLKGSVWLHHRLLWERSATVAAYIAFISGTLLGCRLRAGRCALQLSATDRCELPCTSAKSLKLRRAGNANTGGPLFASQKLKPRRGVRDELYALNNSRPNCVGRTASDLGRKHCG